MGHSTEKDLDPYDSRDDEELYAKSQAVNPSDIFPTHAPG